MSTRRPSLSWLGEFGLIDELTRLTSPRTSRHVIHSIGDDAAVLRMKPGRDVVFTTDMLVEGVHFNRDWSGARDIGWKAMVSNLSDIAAMNAQPTSAVVAIGVPENTPVAWIKDVYRGFRAAAARYGAPIVGGDTVRSPQSIVISIAMLGEVKRNHAVLRSGARPGDVIIVSGELGRCAAALDALKQSAGVTSLRSPLFRKFHRPLPRFDILESLRKYRVRLTSMIDISDGLVSELHHLATSSSVRCVIDPLLVPFTTALQTYARRQKQSVIEWALHSGEEYELLMTCSPRYLRALGNIDDVTIIGTVVRGEGVVDVSGEELIPRGFKHF